MADVLIGEEAGRGAAAVQCQLGAGMEGVWEPEGEEGEESSGQSGSE